MQQVGEAAEGVASLLPFFSKAKHAFFPALQAIKVGWAGRGRRKMTPSLGFLT